MEFAGASVLACCHRRRRDHHRCQRPAALPGDGVVQRYGLADEGRFLIRLPLGEGSNPNAILDSDVREVTDALQTAELPPFKIAARELVSATIGRDLQRQGLYATIASVGAVAGYIAVRFRPSFAVGGIAATFHDALVTLACLSWAGYDLSVNVTAALLTVIGYSVNDTIVIFDRVRENAKALRTEPLTTVINRS